MRLDWRIILELILFVGFILGGLFLVQLVRWISLL